MSNSITRRDAFKLGAATIAVTMTACSNTDEIEVGDINGGNTEAVTDVEIERLEPTTETDNGSESTTDLESNVEDISDIAYDESLSIQPGTEETAATINGLYFPQFVKMIESLFNSCPYSTATKDDFVATMNDYSIELDDSCFEAFTDDGLLAEPFDVRRSDILMAIAAFPTSSSYVVVGKDQDYNKQMERPLDAIEGDRIAEIEIWMMSGLVPVTATNVNSEVKKAINVMRNDKNASQYLRVIRFEIEVNNEGQPTTSLRCVNPKWWESIDH